MWRYRPSTQSWYVLRMKACSHRIWMKLHEAHMHVMLAHAVCVGGGGGAGVRRGGGDTCGGAQVGTGDSLQAASCLLHAHLICWDIVVVFNVACGLLQLSSRRYGCCRPACRLADLSLNTCDAEHTWERMCSSVVWPPVVAAVTAACRRADASRLAKGCL